MPTVLITGCSSGFGLLAALECARRGDRVFATMRDPARGNDLRGLAEAERLNIDIRQLDVCDADSVSSAVSAIIADARGLDALVNNAGIGRLGPLEEFSDEEVFDMYNTNVFGPIRMMRAVLPHMREARSGVIINVSSLGGLVSPPHMSLYASSKFALEGLTEGVGSEVQPYGIRVISIAPAGYDTPIAVKGDTPPANHSDDSPYRDEFATVRELHLKGMRERDNPEEVAEAIADAVRDPEFPLRKVLPESLAFVDTSRGATPPDATRAMMRQTYGLS